MRSANTQDLPIIHFEKFTVFPLQRRNKVLEIFTVYLRQVLIQPPDFHLYIYL